MCDVFSALNYKIICCQSPLLDLCSDNLFAWKSTLVYSALHCVALNAIVKYIL